MILTLTLLLLGLKGDVVLDLEASARNGLSLLDLDLDDLLWDDLVLEDLLEWSSLGSMMSSPAGSFSNSFLCIFSTVHNGQGVHLERT